MDELVAFVTRCLDDDERVAREAGSRVGDGEWLRGPDSVRGATLARVADYAIPPEHIANWDPARVLAEVKAKRAILAEHESTRFGECDTCREPGLDRNQTAPCRTLRLLAQPYAGPTPGQLEQAGHEALMRMRRAGS